jgi:hypothetical protein
MAYLLFNEENILQQIAKEENDFNIMRGNLSHYKDLGKLKTVSEDNYKAIVAGEKKAVLTDGNVVLTDITDSTFQYDQESFQLAVDKQLELINEFLENWSSKLDTSNFSGLKTRINNYKTALTNLDVSSLSFPITTDFFRYWYDNQSSEPFSSDYLH